MNTPARSDAAALPASAPPLLLTGPHDFGQHETRLRGTFNTLLQYLPVMVAAFVAALFLSSLYLLVTPAVYRVDALVQVEDRKAPPTGTAPQASALQLPPMPLQGEIDTLRSRHLLLKSVIAAGADISVDVANRFPLIGRAYARWHATRVGGLANAPLGLSGFAWGGEKLELAAFDVPEGWLDQPFRLIASGSGRNATWQLFDDTDELVAKGRVGVPVDFKVGGRPARLHVTDIIGAPGVKFALEKRSPAVVFEELTRRNLQVTESTRQSGVIRIVFETPDAERGTRLLEELTRNYVQYTVERRTAEAQQSLRFLEEQLPALKQKLDASEQALAVFRTRTRTLNVDQETQSSLLRSQQLSQNLVETQLRQQMLAQRYLSGHPEMQAVQRQKDIIEREMRQLQGQANNLPANQRDFVQLQREAQTNATLYTALLTSAQELKLARAGMTASARVIDIPAATDRPIKPQPAVVFSLAAAFGVLLGVAFAFIHRQLRPTVQDGDDIEQQTGLATLAYIPESSRQRQIMSWTPLPRPGTPRLLAEHAPAEPAIESLRTLRSTLTLPGEDGTKTLLIASPTAGLGKTFIAANLAALLATSNQRVLLIDADLRRPRLHRYFRLDSAAGLAELLAGNARFADVAQRSVLPNLDLLLAGRTLRNPADLLTSPALRRLLDGLEERYDWVLIDSPPVLPVADSLNFAQFGLRTYLVARAERTTVRELREAGRRIEAVGGRVQGVLFNGIKRARFGNLSYYGYPEAA